MELWLPYPVVLVFGDFPELFGNVSRPGSLLKLRASSEVSEVYRTRVSWMALEYKDRTLELQIVQPSHIDTCLLSHIDYCRDRIALRYKPAAESREM